MLRKWEGKCWGTTIVILYSGIFWTNRWYNHACHSISKLSASFNFVFMSYIAIPEPRVLETCIWAFVLQEKSRPTMGINELRGKRRVRWCSQNSFPLPRDCFRIDPWILLRIQIRRKKNRFCWRRRRRGSSSLARSNKFRAFFLFPVYYALFPYNIIHPV